MPKVPKNNIENAYHDSPQERVQKMKGSKNTVERNGLEKKKQKQRGEARGQKRVGFFMKESDTSSTREIVEKGIVAKNMSNADNKVSIPRKSKEGDNQKKPEDVPSRRLPHSKAQDNAEMVDPEWQTPGLGDEYRERNRKETGVKKNKKEDEERGLIELIRAEEKSKKEIEAVVANTRDFKELYAFLIKGAGRENDNEEAGRKISYTRQVVREMNDVDKKRFRTSPEYAEEICKEITKKNGIRDKVVELLVLDIEQEMNSKVKETKDKQKNQEQIKKEGDNTPKKQVQEDVLVTTKQGEVQKENINKTTDHKDTSSADNDSMTKENQETGQEKSAVVIVSEKEKTSDGEKYIKSIKEASDINELLEILSQMDEEGVVVQGSGREYTPGEVSKSIFNVHKIIFKDGASDEYFEELAKNPEAMMVPLRGITRGGVLRLRDKVRLLFEQDLKRIMQKRLPTKELRRTLEEIQKNQKIAEEESVAIQDRANRPQDWKIGDYEEDKAVNKKRLDDLKLSKDIVGAKIDAVENMKNPELWELVPKEGDDSKGTEGKELRIDFDAEEKPIKTWGEIEKEFTELLQKTKEKVPPFHDSAKGFFTTNQIAILLKRIREGELPLSSIVRMKEVGGEEQKKSIVEAIETLLKEDLNERWASVSSEEKEAEIKAVEEDLGKQNLRVKEKKEYYEKSQEGFRKLFTKKVRLNQLRKEVDALEQKAVTLDERLNRMREVLEKGEREKREQERKSQEEQKQADIEDQIDTKKQEQDNLGEQQESEELSEAQENNIAKKIEEAQNFQELYEIIQTIKKQQNKQETFVPKEMIGAIERERRMFELRIQRSEGKEGDRKEFAKKEYQEGKKMDIFGRIRGIRLIEDVGIRDMLGKKVIDLIVQNPIELPNGYDGTIKTMVAKVLEGVQKIGQIKQEDRDGLRRLYEKKIRKNSPLWKSATAFAKDRGVDGLEPQKSETVGGFVKRTEIERTKIVNKNLANDSTV
ncbi:MAG: hypothetical protein KC736_01840 [Candidatus Moranbacteria bacterium]|nr:hypothetical protein [Candidatus Moranbacteria bacterium]